jgi:hypothetical protein
MRFLAFQTFRCLQRVRPEMLPNNSPIHEIFRRRWQEQRVLFRGNQKAQFRIPATTLRGHQHTCHRESGGDFRSEVTNPNVNSTSRKRQLGWEGQLQKKASSSRRRRVIATFVKSAWSTTIPISQYADQAAHVTTCAMTMNSRFQLCVRRGFG